jgi:hypothetical protein
MKRRSSRISVLLALWLMSYQSVLLLPAAAQDESQERDIEAKEVLRSRRQSANRKLTTSYHYRVRQPANPKGATMAAQQFPIGPPPKDKAYITIGVTLWRVRLATEAESKDPKVSKERMTWDQQEREVVVVRMSDESTITDQDLIQLSIEYLPDRQGVGLEPSNRAGYLYVINREQFADSSLRNARLIFPTQLTYGGDNRVLPGKTVTLPDPDRPFRIKRSDSAQRQAYETYTIILSPEPLTSELPQGVGRRAMELSPDLVAKWERQWRAGEVRADLRIGIGEARTQRELGANGDRGETRSTVDSDEDLTQDDPPPQTVFRRVVKPGAIVLINIRLPFKDASKL